MTDSLPPSSPAFADRRRFELKVPADFSRSPSSAPGPRSPRFWYGDFYRLLPGSVRSATCDSSVSALQHHTTPRYPHQHSGLLRRLLAQTDISFSNSLIESWWRALKHQWLYLNTLNTISRLKKLVTFYVVEHNTHLPHSAFRGQTPNETYFGTGDRIADELEAAKRIARQSRMKLNRTTSCSMCRPLELIAS